MIARVLLLTGILPLTVCSGAQITGVTETGATTTAETGATANVAGKPQPEREWRDVIRNASKQKIEALHVTFSCTREDGRVEYDDNGSMDARFQFSHDRPIPVAGSFLSKVIGRGDCTARTDAVVYGDGDVEGDADKIDLIFQRRTGTYKALSFVIPLLDNIASGKSNAAAVIARLRESIQGLSNDRTLSSGETTGESYVLAGTITVLQTPGGWLETPSDRTANRQPRIDDVARKTGASPEQAQAFVTANKYREWRSALEDHTTPPGGN